VCLHPGRGESGIISSVDGICDLTQEPRKEQKYFRFGRGDQKSMKQGVSKQNGQTSSSLNWTTAKALFQRLRTTSCKDRYCRDRDTELSQRIGSKFGRPIWSKTWFKRCKWESEEKRIALDHQYWCQTENSGTRSTEFRRNEVVLAQPQRRSEEDEDGRSRRVIHSASFEPVSSSHQRRTMVSRPLIRTGCYGRDRRLKMNRPSLLRHESETGFINRKLDHGEFRLNIPSRPTRFRPREDVYDKRKLRQRQPGFSILSRRLLRFRIRSRKGEDTCERVNGRRKLRQRQPGFSTLSRRLLRFRIRNREREGEHKLNNSHRSCSEYSDIRILRSGSGRSEAREIINSGIVTDRTGDLQATIDEINFCDLMSKVQGQCASGDISQLSPNDELEKGELEETARSRARRMNQQLAVTQLHQHSENNGKQAIMQQLLSTESLTGAQRLQSNAELKCGAEKTVCNE